ncbi:MAG: hypothetical protein ACI4Q6_06125 [Huintestinicola sp.]
MTIFANLIMLATGQSYHDGCMIAATIYVFTLSPLTLFCIRPFGRKLTKTFPDIRVRVKRAVQAHSVIVNVCIILFFVLTAVFKSKSEGAFPLSDLMIILGCTLLYGSLVYILYALSFLITNIIATIVLFFVLMSIGIDAFMYTIYALPENIILYMLILAAGIAAQAIGSTLSGKYAGERWLEN